MLTYSICPSPLPAERSLPIELKASSNYHVNFKCIHVDIAYLQEHEGPELRSYMFIQRADVQALSKSMIHKARDSAFISVAHTHTSAPIKTLTQTHTFLQVVLQPVEVTPERPLPHIKFQRPHYKAETTVEPVLVVVAGNCDSCVL